MTFFKQFSMALVATAAATSAFAANQPITESIGKITVDAATINSKLQGYAISAVGGATYNSVDGVLTTPVKGVTTPTNPGAIDVELGDAAGLQFTKLLNPTITLSNFSFNTANNELSGNLTVKSAFVNMEVLNQSVLVASNVTSSLGGQLGTNVFDSATPRNLGLTASGFALSNSFKDYIATNFGLDAAQFSYVADLIKEVKVGAVPEPSTYAMMGVGLVCVGFVARRRKQAA